MDGFIKISKYAGMREDLVQASGGNSSYKMDNHKMYIKASGYQLADLSKEKGYAIVDSSKFRDFFMNSDDLENMSEADGKKILEDAFLEGAKPSIETFLHSIVGRYVLHTHPVVVNALTCRKAWKDELRDLFPDSLLVPYATPGIELAKKYFREYKEYGVDRIPDIIFLQNHGLIISGETADEVIDKTENVIKVIEAYVGCDNSEYHNLTSIWSYFPQKIVWRVSDLQVLSYYSEHAEEFRYQFCPDCIVFLGKKVLGIDENDISKSIMNFKMMYAEPVLVYYRESLYIVADSVRKALDIQSVLSFSVQVMKINQKSECCYLNVDEQNFLLDWDAEKYRKNIVV